MWWHPTLIPALGRQWHADVSVQGQPGLYKAIQANEGYIVRPWLPYYYSSPPSSSSSSSSTSSSYIVKGSLNLPSLVPSIPIQEGKGWSSRSRNPMPVLRTVRVILSTSRQLKEWPLLPAYLFTTRLIIVGAARPGTSAEPGL